MKIPKKFKLMGQTINVYIDEGLVQKEDAVGQSHYRFNKILIQPSIDGVARTEEQIGHTFCHELTHWIFHTLNEDKLSGDEKLVDNFSGLLFQALESAEYEKSK